MVRGHNNKLPPTSAVKAEARRNPAPRMRPKAKATLIVDDRPSQWKKGHAKAPEWLESKRSKHEKIPGTRIQCAKGGWPVRVVLADGTEFPVDKVALVKKHLRKLAQKEQEQREIDSIISGVAPGAAAKAEALGGATAAVAAAAARKGKRKARAEAKVDEKGSKKARKEEAWRQRQQKLVELHKASMERDGRQLLSDEWHYGEVVQRTSGRAWVKLRSPERLPAELLEKLRGASEAARHEFSLSGDLLPVLFGDVAEQGLNLQAGVAVHFRVYTDRNGAGGCEVSSVEGSPKPPVGEQPAKGKASAKRRRKAEPSKAEGASAQEAVLVEVAEKAEPHEADVVSAKEPTAAGATEKAVPSKTEGAPAQEAAAAEAESALAQEAAAPEAADKAEQSKPEGAVAEEATAAEPSGAA